ncbi:hypothetical protein [Bacillus mojavensis]|uniref:hypothetical protein n=1 Tax=Bacillus mojavensis TaxID=72360 RepID=UPI002DB5C099|nr:hypothetical protein [Bacillus mojavensis]MEC1686003.1 hypothetical protein [Bacillus mojavensis]MEC1710207.1 hypothetical protein [Bacillus mojavensis]
MFLGLTKKEKEILKYEIISPETRLKFTRYIRSQCLDEEKKVRIVHLNRIINIANSVIGRKNYVLDPQYDDGLLEIEYGWHFGELELILRIPNTIQFIEIIIDLLEQGILSLDVVSKLFNESSASFYIEETEDGFQLTTFSLTEEAQFNDIDEHPNIRLLIDRMNLLFDKQDYSGVLHTSATILETLAKDIINRDTIGDQSLGSFIELYKKESRLPNEILGYIHAIYKKRNLEPLAGHGSTSAPSINKKEAIIISEMTKSFVLMESKLSMDAKLEL